MSARLEHAKQTWQVALNEALPRAEFVHALVAMHLNQPQLLTKDLLWRHTDTLASIFQNYAQQQPEYLSLSSHDQTRLIKKNCPKFVLYMLAGYISATDDGLTQLSWLLPAKIPTQVRMLRPKAVTPCELNSVLGLFSERNMENFASVIRDAKWWNLDDGYLFSLVCLFDDDGTREQCEDFLILSEWSHDVYWIKSIRDDIRDILRVLENADAFLTDFSTNVKHNLCPLRRRQVFIGFTNEEDLGRNSPICTKFLIKNPANFLLAPPSGILLLACPLTWQNNSDNIPSNPPILLAIRNILPSTK
jgi:hypothetical protein